MSRIVPNYDFITISEVNSIIHKYGRNVDKVYHLNTWEIESDGWKPITNIRVDFLIMSHQIVGDMHEWIFEIRNTLWNGKYTLINLPAGVNPVTSQPGGNPNILKISGRNLDNFTLVLHLTNVDENRVVEVNNITVDTNTNLNYPYYEEKTIRPIIKDVTGTVIPNATVQLIHDNTILQTEVTDHEGKVGLTFPRGDPGDYDFLIRIISNDLGNYNKVINVKREKENTNFNIPIPNIFKGSIPVFNCGLFFTAEESKKAVINKSVFVSTNVNDTVLGVAVSDDDKFNFSVNLRETDNTLLKVTLDVAETFYTKKASFTFELPINKFTPDSWQDIVEQASNVNGTNVIYLKNKNYLSNGHAIKLRRSMTFKGLKGDGWATLDGNFNSIIMSPYSSNDKPVWYDLTFEGIKFTRGDNAIFCYDYINLKLDSCLFTNCRHNLNNNMGSCVYNSLSSNLKNTSSRFNTVIKDSYFVDNKGSSLCLAGDSTIDTSFFVVKDLECVHQSEPFGISMYHHKLGLKNNFFCFDTEENTYPTNVNYAKMFLWLSDNAIVNSKWRGNDCRSKDALTGLFEMPFNNKSYIYCKYYYPNQINDFVYSSPVVNREALSGAHAVEGENWVYSNNYLVTLANAGLENRNNKPSVLIPNKGGVE